MIKELDYVRTKDGRQGTVVLIFTIPNLAYEIEFDGAEETETILPEAIIEVIESYG
jgi:hypothetical protein